MRIYIDADACPVIPIVEKVAEKNNIAVTLLCDTNYVLDSDYSEVKVIGAGADAVDFALINLSVHLVVDCLDWLCYFLTNWKLSIQNEMVLSSLE